MTEKSPLDMINDIYTLLSKMDSKIDILSKTLNMMHGKLNNKINAPTSEPMQIQAPSNLQDSLDKTQKKLGVPLKPSDVLVHGKVFNMDKQPVYGVMVKISDSNNKPVKNAKTNTSGYWEVRLPIGKFSIKYMKEGMPPSYRIVNINEDQESVEVI